MRIVVMGDSISEGQYLTPGEKAWPFLIKGSDDIVNHGVSNDTTRMMLERFPRDVQELEPEIVIMQAGHNDANHWESDRGLPRVARDAYQANLREMIRRVRQFDAMPMVCTIVPSLRAGSYNKDLERYNDALLVACEVCDVEVIDVRAAFAAAKSLEPLLLDDRLHLSAAGHKLYAGTVEKALRALRVAA